MATKDPMSLALDWWTHDGVDRAETSTGWLLRVLSANAYGFAWYIYPIVGWPYAANPASAGHELTREEAKAKAFAVAATMKDRSQAAARARAKDAAAIRAGRLPE